MTLPEFLTRDQTGEIRLTEHRIGLFHLVHYYNDGYSAEMLASRFPTLSLAIIHKTIAYYLENQADVDAYVADCQNELDRGRQENPNRIDAVALRQRLQATQRAEGQ